MTKERLKYLLDRFLENKATEEELKEYADWYSEAGQQGLEMLPTDATEEYTTNLYGRIIQEIDEKEKPRRMVFMRWAAAACLVLIAGAIFFYNNRQKDKAIGIAKVETKQTDTSATKSLHFDNHTANNKRIRLEDSSVVDLFPESELVCEYSHNRRELRLTGKGFFKVEKDPSKPFTVYSGDISTTALGTSFTVTAYQKSSNIEVALHTGKVVVKGNKMKDAYLLPGHSLAYNTNTGMTTLSLKPSVGTEASKTAAYSGRTGYAASFDQTPLTEVLDAIAKEYKVPMRYNKWVLSDMYFSGQILETDSLAKVLKRIALLHNLTIKATAKGYIIRKDQ